MLAVEFEGVFKRFTLRHEPKRAFQELFVNFWKRGSQEEFWALKDVSFRVERGETLGIIGPNGAGKSTLLRLVGRILEPTSGRIVVEGKVAALLGLGLGFHPDLTGRENIYLNGSLLGFSRQEMRKRLQGIVEFAELESFIDVPLRQYSSGMWLRLGFSVAAGLEPNVLLIDEVLAVGDARFQQKCSQRIQEFQKDEVTIVLVSHDSNAIRRLCDRAILLNEGRIVAMGQPKGVVDIYHALIFERPGTATEGQAEAWGRILAQRKREKQRYGTGQAQILEAELLNEDGHRVTTMTSGEPATIRIKVLFKETISNPLVGITIRDRLGTEIYMTNTEWKGMNLGTVKAGETLTVDFQQEMWLGEGNYSATVGVGQSTPVGITKLDWIADYLTFSVTPHGGARGLLNLNSEVTVSKGRSLPDR